MHTNETMKPYQVRISFELDFTDSPGMMPENIDELPFMLDTLRHWFQDWETYYLTKIMECTARPEREDWIPRYQARLDLVGEIFKNFVVQGKLGNGDEYQRTTHSPGFYEALTLNGKLIRMTE